MKEKIIVFAFLVLALFLSGCVEELGNCMAKCSEVCSLIKEKNIDLNGFNNLQLKKTTGSTTLSCSCPCESAPQKYQCPDKSRLEYDASSDTYKEWIDCMPVTTNPLCSGNSAKEYEQWVNQNCGIKFEVGFAV